MFRQLVLVLQYEDHVSYRVGYLFTLIVALGIEEHDLLAASKELGVIPT